ncbi:MAG: hypothetical protein FWC06_08430 [Treponema sp.]|nr:hypothetical protein [Treponema sp.]
MRKTANLPALIILIIIFSITACDDPGGQQSVNTERAHKGDVLEVIDQKVWIRNGNAIKLSQTHLPFNENRIIKSVIRTYSSPNGMFIGDGNIANGFMDFSVNASIDESNLLEWDDFKYYFPTLTLWDDHDVDPSSVKGNAISLLAYPDGSIPSFSNYNGMLTREKFTGTSSTITCETIFYVYVDNDCVITGNKSEGYRPGQYYYRTKGNLRLSLRKGWNMICGIETYGKNFNGSAEISLEIKDPLQNPENYKWVIHNTD